MTKQEKAEKMILEILEYEFQNIEKSRGLKHYKKKEKEELVPEVFNVIIEINKMINQKKAS